jgi:DNA-binding NarL/FixJ family response regulator
MDLVICGSHRLFLDGLADALRSVGHTVSGTCYRLDWLPTVLSTMDPDACLLAAGRADGFGLRAATAARRSTPGTPLVLLLTEPADGEVWNAFDSGLIDGIADTTTCLSELDAALRRTVAGLDDVAARPAPTPSRPQAVEQTLTRREMEVLQLLATDMATAPIAQVLGVSANTVCTHVANLLTRLMMHERRNAACRAVQLGLADRAAALPRRSLVIRDLGRDDVAGAG